MGFIVLIYGSLFVSVFLHEIGHAIAVRMVNYKMVAFKVGPFCIVSHDGGWRFVLAKEIFLGLVVFSAEAHQRTLKNEAIVTSGGIVANIAGGAALVVMYFVLRDVHENGLIMIIGAASIFTGVLNMFPVNIKNSGLESDGVVLRKLYKTWRSKPNNQRQSTQ